MNEGIKPKYIGPREIHDATIISLSKSEDTLFVIIKDYEGKKIIIKILKVKEIKSNTSENMMLYALIEETVNETLKKYIFVNWEDEDTSSLEVIAENIEFIKENT